MALTHAAATRCDPGFSSHKRTMTRDTLRAVAMGSCTARLLQLVMTCSVG